MNTNNIFLNSQKEYSHYSIFQNNFFNKEIRYCGKIYKLLGFTIIENAIKNIYAPISEEENNTNIHKVIDYTNQTNTENNPFQLIFNNYIIQQLIDQQNYPGEKNETSDSFENIDCKTEKENVGTPPNNSEKVASDSEKAEAIIILNDLINSGQFEVAAQIYKEMDPFIRDRLSEYTLQPEILMKTQLFCVSDAEFFVACFQKNSKEKLISIFSNCQPYAVANIKARFDRINQAVEKFSK